MTPHVLKLDFDTHIFGFPCGRFELGDAPVSSDEIDRLMVQAARWNLRHVVVRVPAEWSGARAMLAARGFRVAVTSVWLEKDFGSGSLLEKEETRKTSDATGTRPLSRPLPRGERGLRRTLEREDWSKATSDVAPADASSPVPIAGVEVRRYQHEDDARLVEITVDAFQSGTRFHAEPLFPCEAIDRLHSEWIHNLIAHESVSIFTAHCEGRIAGYVTVSRETDSHCGHIGLFAVDPAYHSRGIGSALLLAAESDMREPSHAMTGLQVITVMTEESNASALHLYKRSGYTVRRLWTVMQAALGG